MYAFVYYVPTSHLETVNDALFAAGAGKIGSYDKCFWSALGQGHYRPLQGSTPFHGDVEQSVQLDEIKVETVCDDLVIDDVIAALKKNHPYETPAYHFWKINTR